MCSLYVHNDLPPKRGFRSIVYSIGKKKTHFCSVLLNGTDRPCKSGGGSVKLGVEQLIPGTCTLCTCTCRVCTRLYAGLEVTNVLLQNWSCVI